MAQIASDPHTPTPFCPALLCCRREHQTGHGHTFPPSVGCPNRKGANAFPHDMDVTFEGHRQRSGRVYDCKPLSSSPTNNEIETNAMYRTYWRRYSLHNRHLESGGIRPSTCIHVMNVGLWGKVRIGKMYLLYTYRVRKRCDFAASTS